MAGPQNSQFPQQPSVPSSGGVAGLESMISGGMPQISDDMILKALSPSFSSHSLSVPAKMTQPIPDFKPAPMDEREVVGKGNARAQGIGNAITGVANGIGAFVNAKAKMKQTQNAQKVTQLIDYQQGIDAAQEALKIDPNNAEAKTALEKNQHNRDSLFEDKQFVRTVQKGFNISFTDPSANKTEDHAAVQQGIQDAKSKASSYGQQWADKQPTKPTPNILAMQHLAINQAAQQQYAKVYAAVLPKIIAAREASVRVQYVQSQNNYRQMLSFAAAAAKQQALFNQQNHLAQVKHEFKLGEIYQSIQWGGQKMEELFRMEKLDPTVLMNSENQFTEKMVGAEGTLNSALATLVGRKAQASNALGHSTSDNKGKLQESIKQLDDQIASVQLQQKNLQGFKTSTYDVFKNLKNISAGLQGSDNAAGAGTNSNSTNGAGSGAVNAFDPNTLLHNQPFNYGDTPATSAILPNIEDETFDDDEE